MLGNISLLAGALVVSIVATELVWTGFEAARSDGGEIEVVNYEFTYTASLNEQGFRDDTFQKKKPTDALRVFVIGDSFVYGVGIGQEGTIPALMEASLRERLDRPVEVWNLGDSGASTNGYLRIARRFADFEPDVVFLALYVDNDVTTTGRERQKWIVNRHVYRLIDTALRRATEHECVYAYVHDYDVDPVLKEQTCKGRINPGLLKRGALGDNEAYYRRMAARFVEDPNTRDNIRAVRDQFPNAVFRLVLLPSKYQADAAYLDAMSRIGFENTGREVTDTLQQTITRWAEKTGIRTMDLLPAIRAEERSGRDAYFTIDDHYNANGAAATAKVLTEEVLRNLP